MGHCSSIALGIALAKPKRNVICIDGDGSISMHLGSVTSIANLKPENFYHILMNNESHESVGGQKTSAEDINFSSLILSMGIENIYSSESILELESTIKGFLLSRGPSFLELKIKSESRKNLGRPTISPINNKKDFMKFLEI